jgi:hypothetical protein
VKNKLFDSRLLRQRLETFLNFPRGGLEVCGAVYRRLRGRPLWRSLRSIIALVAIALVAATIKPHSFALLPTAPMPAVNVP